MEGDMRLAVLRWAFCRSMHVGFLHILTIALSHWRSVFSGSGFGLVGGMGCRLV
jgi:hypothetical protein